MTELPLDADENLKVWNYTRKKVVHTMAERFFSLPFAQILFKKQVSHSLRVEVQEANYPLSGHPAYGLK